MATSSAMNLSGLASGIDTSTIVDQLMAIERQPQNRLKLKLSQSDARKQVLKDIESRLKNLQLAVNDLKSPALWADTQTVDVNDTTKVAATRLSGTGSGSYQLSISQLARGSQRWYTYTAPAADDTITFSGGHTVTIAAGSDINAAVSTINSDSASPVYASAVTDAATGTQYLVFSSRTTGATASAFTATGGSLTEDATRAVAGQDAQYSVDGGPVKTSSTNVVTDAIPGLQLTLKGTTTVSGPVSITVGAPAPDQSAIQAKVKAFVDQYNSTIDFIRSKLDEKRVPNPQTTADASKGLLNGDTMLEGLLSQMRIAITGQFATGNPTTLDELSEIGVSTGAAVGSGGLNQDAIEGKLTLDAGKLSAALASDPQSVRNLLGANTSVADGFSQAFAAILDPTVQAGGTMDSRIDSEATNHKTISDQIAAMDVLLNQKQEMLKQQFAAMEAALQQSQSQGQWLQGQLAALPH